MKSTIKKIFPKLLWNFLREIKNKSINFYPYHLFRYLNIIKIEYNISSNLSFGKIESKYFKNQLNQKVIHVI